MGKAPLQDAASGKPEVVDIAIIGGGIAGLYCALKYSGARFQTVRVYEASSKPGGRISTELFGAGSEVEFDAEFGPMRIEPEHQELLKALLDELGIREKQPRVKPSRPRPTKDSAKKNTVSAAKISAAQTPCLIDFPPYASPVDLHEPRYDLSGEERDQKTALDLLKLAFVRIFGRLVSQGGGGASTLSWSADDEAPKRPPAEEGDEIAKEALQRAAFEQCLEKGRRALMLAVATHQPEWRGSFQHWIDQLQEEDYQNIREYAELEYENGDQVPLWQMGFWNLISDVLSHDAVMKLRDQGSFYHLIPENPNAVEWLVFWLRALKTSHKLQGIEGGMKSLIDGIMSKLPKDRQVVCRQKLVRMCLDDDDQTRVRLSFENEDGAKLPEVIAKHVILALPKAPLQKIVARSSGSFSTEIRDHLDRCSGFPMTKVFIVVKQRWWEEEQRANMYAGRVPTRELHYWKSRVEGSRRGMIMAYADRPGANFWANYLRTSGRQDAPEWEKVPPSLFKRGAILKLNSGQSGVKDEQTQTRRLIYKIVQYLKEIGGETVRETDIEHYGIRDWGREPYCAANHNWYPETRSWAVLRALGGFSLEGALHGLRNVHICGEAYSDYHGFIEGSLRSAAHILHQLDDTHELVDGKKQAADDPQPCQGLQTLTPWLCANSGCACNKDANRQFPPARRVSYRRQKTDRSAAV